MGTTFSYDGWTLSFEDEFDSLSLHNGTIGRWRTSYAWGAETPMINGESQAYVDAGSRGAAAGTLGLDPFRVDDGILTIQARALDAADQPYLYGQTYSSGLLTTQASFAQTYGYFEISARMPAGQGLWSAFWLLPVAQGSAGEMDVVEALGRDPTRLYTNLHPDRPDTLSDLTETRVADMSAGFHRYGMAWQPDAVIWYFDGREVARTTPLAEHHQPMYLLLNLAVGGNWAGSPDPASTVPGSMQIDYVRAYTRDPGVYAPAAVPVRAITGTSANQSLTGTTQAERIDGREGADTLAGGGGNDVLTGGSGNDLFVIRRGQGSDIITDFAAGVGAGDVVKLEGSGFGGVSQVLRALRQDGGAVVLDLGQGETLTFQNRRVADFAANDFMVPLEPEASRSATKWLVGTASAEKLAGTAYSEFIDDQGGPDTMTGGLGDDTYVVNHVGDVVIEAAGGGIDTLKSSLRAVGLGAWIEHVRLGGGASGMIGNDLGNRLTGAAGSDRLDGKGGNDRLTGGAGCDSFVVARGAGSDTIADFQGGTGAGDRVVLVDTAFSGLSAIQSAMTQVGSDVRLNLGNGQVLTFEDTVKSSFAADDFVLVSSTRIPAVFTLAASASPTRWLTGGKRNDSLRGGNGADFLNGDSGVDTLVGGKGDDTYIVDSVADRVIESAGSGIDTVKSWSSRFVLPDHVEHLKLEGLSPASGIGNGLGNRLDGNAGANSLWGGAGNDILAGGGGNDTLAGGEGRDLFVMAGLGQGIDLITDFSLGEDRIDLRPLLRSLGYTGTKPFADGRLHVRAQTDGTAALWAGTGKAGGQQQILIIDLYRPQDLPVDQVFLVT